MNIEQGIMNDEVSKLRTSIFLVRYSIFKVVKRKVSFSFCICFLFFLSSFSQDTLRNKKRTRAVIISETVLGAAAFTGLNQLWYKDYPRSSFHFFNDNPEWLQVDKAGHVFSSYYLGVQGINVFKWCGMETNKAAWLGGSLGFAYLSLIETLDGFSSQWGFSPGDMLSNGAGALLAIGQDRLWKEQRLRVKYSFTSEKYYSYRTQLLGSSAGERLLKDYNSQTYWLSLNLHSFLKTESRFPRWMNLALGYGANGMTGGKKNPSVDEKGNALPPFARYRQYYLSLDADLSRIRLKSRLLKCLAETFSCIKIPFPAIEYTGSQVKYYAFFF